MPKTRFLAFATATFALAIGAAATAQQDFSGELRARQGQMQMMGHHLGIVGNMARGNVAYDAALAQAAADNLVIISTIDPATLWTEGSDNASIENSRALPALWADYDQFLVHMDGLETAATGLAAVAGDGLEALQGAMGPMGSACGACHDDFRQPTN